VLGFFPDWVSWIICLGWLLTTILLISASWVARMWATSAWLVVIFIFKIHWTSWICRVMYFINSQPWTLQVFFLNSF
jgi:hypothetical protein